METDVRKIKRRVYLVSDTIHVHICSLMADNKYICEARENDFYTTVSFSMSEWAEYLTWKCFCFRGGRKTEEPGENPQSIDGENQQQTHPTYSIRPDSNPSQIGGR